MLYHWVTTQTVFFSSFLFWDRVSFTCSVFQLTVSDHDLNFESSSRVTELCFFFFTSGHILDFKDNPNILQTSLPLPSWYFFFPFHSFPLFFETVLLCNPGRSWYHNSLASIPTTEMIGHWNEGYVWKKKHKITRVYLGTLLHLYLICKFQKDVTLQKWFIETGCPTHPMCTHGI